MDTGFITLMRKLAPDLTEEMTRRALILERISVLQPVGRRQLASRLNLPEREIRNTVETYEVYTAFKAAEKPYKGLSVTRCVVPAVKNRVLEAHAALTGEIITLYEADNLSDAPRLLNRHHLKAFFWERIVEAHGKVALTFIKESP